MLLDDDEMPFEDMHEAKKYVRANKSGHCGLANFEQMKMGNAQWDTF